jgi:FAD:protein FMN transferase
MIAAASVPTSDATDAHASVTRARIIMGTTVAIEARAVSRIQARAGIDAAFAAVAAVNERLHPEEPGSDLVALCSAPPGTPVRIAPQTLEVLLFASELAAASAGVFDPCVPESAGRMCDLELQRGECPGAIAHLPLRIDCGGIAKGYAVDQAVMALRAAGCSAGLVNAGGDVRVFGSIHARLLLREPDGNFRPLALTDAALAVSERTGARRPSGHRGYYRRVGADPGREVRAAVRASCAMVADALTKCVLLCPPRESRALLARFGADRVA